jgi:hypothetical protein
MLHTQEQYVNFSVANENVDSWIKKDTAVAGTTYFGYAELGSNPAAAVWKIRREVVASNVTTVEYADGDLKYDNIWNNRASLTYK